MIGIARGKNLLALIFALLVFVCAPAVSQEDVTVEQVADSNEIQISKKEMRKQRKEQRKKERESKKEKKAKKERRRKVKRIRYNEDSYRAAIVSGNFDDAMGMLVGQKKLTSAQQMDLGLFYHYAGDWQTAAQTMEEASRSIGDYFGAYLNDAGAKKSSGGAIINESVTKYRGNIYEYLLVDTFNALNYYHIGEIGSAYSCVVRVGDKQKEYAAKYQYLLEDDEDDGKLDSALKSASASGYSLQNPRRFLPAKPTERNIYKTSPMADYLQIVLGAQNGSVIDDYIVRELKVLAPEVESDSASISPGCGRIEVLALTGKIAQRNEYVVNVPTSMSIGGAPIKFKYTWPVYSGNAAEVPVATKITLSNGSAKIPILLEDFDDDVQNDVTLNARRHAWRSIVRSTTTKLTAAITALESLRFIDNDLLKSIALASAIGGLEALDLKEMADVRQSMALPSKAYCAGFTVVPGTYSVAVEYSNGVLETIENVVVSAGKPILVESVCR